MNSSLQELQYKRAAISELREEGLAAAAVMSLLLRMNYDTAALAPILMCVHTSRMKGSGYVNSQNKQSSSGAMCRVSWG